MRPAPQTVRPLEGVEEPRLALNVAVGVRVLETGSVILSGTGRELMENPRVKEAYVGG